MSDRSPDPDKPKRLYFKTYMQMVRNSVGTELFRNFYVETKARGEFDSMSGGELSCAFYVSGLLRMFEKVARVHGTVASTVKDMENSGWQVVDGPKSGDVLVWEKAEIEGDLVDHVGFYVGKGRAISNSYKTRTPIEHDMNFADSQPRKIIKILRMEDWQDGRS